MAVLRRAVAVAASAGPTAADIVVVVAERVGSVAVVVE